MTDYTLMQWYDIAPMGKPRETQSDKWNKRPVVLRFRAFRDFIRLKTTIDVPKHGLWIVFNMEIPKSRRKEGLAGKPHDQKPDLDNCVKALKDSLWDEDRDVWDYHVTKYWSEKPSIEIWVSDDVIEQEGV